MKVETTALSIKHIAQMYCVNGKHFADLYRNKISGYADWCEQELGCGFYFNEGVAELPLKNKSKSLNFPKLRLFYVHKIL